MKNFFLYFTLTATTSIIPASKACTSEFEELHDIPTLSILCSNAIRHRIHLQAKDADFTLLEQVTDTFTPLFLLNTVFESPYTLSGQFPIDLKFTQHVPSLDLSSLLLPEGQSLRTRSLTDYISHLSNHSESLPRLLQHAESNKNLFSLNISHFCRRELVPHVLKLSSLTFLDISSNKLGKTCEGLTTLTALTTLNLSDNHLHELDSFAFLEPLSRLSELDISSNNLARNTQALTTLEGLKLNHLNISWNCLGERASLLSGLTKLQHLDISFNNLGEHVTFLTNLRNLKTLDVSGNNLAEVIDESISTLKALPRLMRLKISDYHIYGYTWQGQRTIGNDNVLLEPIRNAFASHSTIQIESLLHH